MVPGETESAQNRDEKSPRRPLPTHGRAEKNRGGSTGLDEQDRPGNKRDGCDCGGEQISSSTIAPARRGASAPPSGIGGPLLLVGVLGPPLVAAARQRGSPLVPAALGAYLAFLFHAAVDWDWQVPAGTIRSVLPRRDAIVDFVTCRIQSRGGGSGGMVATGSIDYFDQSASAYERLARTRPEFVERLAVFTRLAIQNLRPGGRVLDVGCGTGLMCRALSDRGMAVTGIDGSEAMVALARESVPSGTFYVEPLPLAGVTVQGLDGKFDVVIASSVIEYLADDRSFMEQIYSFLVPGGTALVSFPNGRSLYRPVEGWVRARTRTLRESYLSVQEHQYDADIARLLAEGVGFRHESVEYLGLPLQRLFPGIRSRPSWLSPLFVVTMRRPLGPARPGETRTRRVRC